jgi:membrane protein DedA with SNARE-associated domain
MFAFLKRRWVLLSCAVVAIAGTCVSYTRGEYSGRTHTVYGLSYGNIAYQQSTDVVDIQFRKKRGIRQGRSFHSPTFGMLPEYANEASWYAHYFIISIPIWLPLSAVLGWMVLREMRWREKRAKECSTSDPSK